MTRTTLAALVALSSFIPVPAFSQALRFPQVSPKATVSQTIGITEIIVTYHRPAVKGRVIWGELVPYGFTNLGFGPAKLAPWRAGANANTLIAFEHDVKVAGQPLAAGTYGLHVAIAADGAITVIFSHDTRSWGSFFYDETRDALRVETKWEDALFRELLTYSFSDITDHSAVLALEWEKKRIPIPVEVDTPTLVIARLKEDLRSDAGFHYQAWIDASNYVLANGGDLELALEWADAAISAPFIGERTYRSLSHKAKVLTKLGRKADADAVMKEALPLGTTFDVHQYGRQLIAAREPQRALEVFKLNAEIHPGQWPVNYGLARGYSAVGDFDQALAHLLKAQAEVPEGDTVNPPAIAAAIEKAKRREDIN